MTDFNKPYNTKHIHLEIIMSGQVSFLRKKAIFL
jgi:hypothetical protein